MQRSQRSYRLFRFSHNDIVFLVNGSHVAIVPALRVKALRRKLNCDQARHVPQRPPISVRLIVANEAGALQVLHKPFGDNLGQDLVGVVDALAALKAQRERGRVGKVRRVGGGELVRVGYGDRKAAWLERNKNARRVAPIDVPPRSAVTYSR